MATYSTAAALLLLSPKSDAYEWEFIPQITTRLLFSDNINLASDNSLVQKEADFIAWITPGFYSNFASKRFDSVIDFRLNNIIYANNTERSRTLVNLRARNTLTVVEDLLFVDGNMRMRQQNQSLLGRQGDVVNTTGNLRDIQMYSLSPYMRKRFAGFATTEIRYARLLTDSDASNTYFNSDANVYQGSVESGPDFRTIEWGVNYSREDIKFDRRPKPVKLETGLGNIQYNLNRRFGITGTGGYEDNTFAFGGGAKTSGARWSVGFVWLPTPRTSIEVAGGQRFFGDTYSGELTHRTRLWALHSTYQELVRSIRSEFDLIGTGETLDLLTALITSQAPPGTSPEEIALLAQQLFSNLGLPPNLFFGQDFLTNRFFLEKRFTVSLGAKTKKHTVIFRGFHIKRRPLVPTSALLDSFFGAAQIANSEQEGGNATWIWRVAPRTHVNLVLLFNRIHFPTLFRRDDLKMLRFAVVRHFTERTTGILEYRRRDRTSNFAPAEYSENRFMASLRYQF